MLVGRSGANVAQLKASTDTRIATPVQQHSPSHVPILRVYGLHVEHIVVVVALYLCHFYCGSQKQPLDADGLEAPWSPVEIEGKAANCIDAYFAVASTAEGKGTSLSLRLSINIYICLSACFVCVWIDLITTTMRPALAEVDDCVLELRVLKARHALLRGPHDSTVKRIGADSGARIFIPEPTDRSDVVQVSVGKRSVGDCSNKGELNPNTHVHPTSLVFVCTA